MTYQIKIETGHAMNMATLKLLDTYTARVVFVEEDGKETTAVHVSGYEKSDWGLKRIKAKANGQRLRLFQHLKRTGKRWEIEQKEAAEAKRAKEKAEKEARLKIRDASPELLDALRELLLEVRSWSDDVAFSPATIEKAEAAIKKATA